MRAGVPAKSAQTNGICERFHKIVRSDFSRVAFCKKLYRSIDELQADVDLWTREHNVQRTHQGRYANGSTIVAVALTTRANGHDALYSLALILFLVTPFMR